MDNQHNKIKGYRDLTESDIALMNEVKSLSIEVGKLIEKLKADKSLDQRWISLGRTDLQKGFMETIRGIAQPTTF